MVCTWFGEFCCCCCLPLVTQLAWSIHPTTYKPLFRALYKCTTIQQSDIPGQVLELIVIKRESNETRAHISFKNRQVNKPTSIV